MSEVEVTVILTDANGYSGSIRVIDTLRPGDDIPMRTSMLAAEAAATADNARRLNLPLILRDKR